MQRAMAPPVVHHQLHCSSPIAPWTSPGAWCAPPGAPPCASTPPGRGRGSSPRRSRASRVFGSPPAPGPPLSSSRSRPAASFDVPARRTGRFELARGRAGRRGLHVGAGTDYPEEQPPPDRAAWRGCGLAFHALDRRRSAPIDRAVPLTRTRYGFQSRCRRCATSGRWAAGMAATTNIDVCPALCHEPPGAGSGEQPPRRPAGTGARPRCVPR